MIPRAIAESRWLWGSAQQVNLRVSGVLAYAYQRAVDLSGLHEAFMPLSITLIPSLQSPNCESLLKALPDFNHIPSVPQPLTIDLEQRQLIVFLPGFTKEPGEADSARFCIDGRGRRSAAQYFPASRSSKPCRSSRVNLKRPI